jgi:hypothetical protein
VRSDVALGIKRAVHSWAVSTEQSLAVLQALQRESFPLHRHARMRAGALSAAAFDIAANNHLDTNLETQAQLRVQAAVITELFMASGFILDDVMDGDTPASSTVGIEAGLGTVLLFIANATLDEAAESLRPGERHRLKAAAHRRIPCREHHGEAWRDQPHGGHPHRGRDRHPPEVTSVPAIAGPS